MVSEDGMRADFLEAAQELGSTSPFNGRASSAAIAVFLRSTWTRL